VEGRCHTIFSAPLPRQDEQVLCENSPDLILNPYNARCYTPEQLRPPRSLPRCAWQAKARIKPTLVGTGKVNIRSEGRNKGEDDGGHPGFPSTTPEGEDLALLGILPPKSQNIHHTVETNSTGNNSLPPNPRTVPPWRPPDPSQALSSELRGYG
jgi:hypothetical protein